MSEILFELVSILKNLRVRIIKLLLYLSYDVASGSEITPCIKLDKPLAVYRFSGNVIAPMIICNALYVDCRGRAVTNVGKTCGPTPCFILAISTFKLN